MMRLCYTPAARNDIKNIVKWSAASFGVAAAMRYERLLAVALSEISRNPDLSHSRKLSGFHDGLRSYHWRHQRHQAAVKEPRHFFVYRVAPDEVLVVRVLHERMDIFGQIPGTESESEA